MGAGRLARERRISNKGKAFFCGSGCAANAFSFPLAELQNEAGK